MRPPCLRTRIRLVRIYNAPRRLPLTDDGCGSLDELVKDGVNGLIFHNAEQLATQLEVRISLISCSQTFLTIPCRRACCEDSRPRQHSLLCAPPSTERRRSRLQAQARATGSGGRGRRTGTTRCGRCCCAMSRARVLCSVRCPCMNNCVLRLNGSRSPRLSGRPIPCACNAPTSFEQEHLVKYGESLEPTHSISEELVGTSSPWARQHRPRVCLAPGDAANRVWRRTTRLRLAFLTVSPDARCIPANILPISMRSSRGYLSLFLTPHSGGTVIHGPHVKTRRAALCAFAIMEVRVVDDMLRITLPV